MPIPELRQDLPAPSPVPTRLFLVPLAAAKPRASRLWISRLLAHSIDASLVVAFGIYLAQVSSLLLLFFHQPQIRAAGRAGYGVFRELFNYGEMAISAASISLFAFLFLVAMPSLTKLTPGLGIMGLKVEAADGSHPSARCLLRRLLVSMFYYASFGSLFLLSLRGRDGLFLQDRISETRILRND